MRLARMAIVLVAMVLVLPGCMMNPDGNPFPLHWTPGHQLEAARETFTGVVNTLALLAEQDVFDVETGDAINVLIRAGFATLDRWQAAIELGHPTESLISQFNMILRELVMFQNRGKRTAKERQVSNGPSNNGGVGKHGPGRAVAAGAIGSGQATGRRWRDGDTGGPG